MAVSASASLASFLLFVYSAPGHKHLRGIFVAGTYMAIA